MLLVEALVLSGGPVEAGTLVVTAVVPRGPLHVRLVLVETLAVYKHGKLM